MVTIQNLSPNTLEVFYTPSHNGEKEEEISKTL